MIDGDLDPFGKQKGTILQELFIDHNLGALLEDDVSVDGHAHIPWHSSSKTLRTRTTAMQWTNCCRSYSNCRMELEQNLDWSSWSTGQIHWSLQSLDLEWFDPLTNL